MVIDDQQTTGGGGWGYEEAGGGVLALDSEDRNGPRRQERSVKVRKISSWNKGVCIHFLLKFPVSIVVCDNFVFRRGFFYTLCNWALYC